MIVSGMRKLGWRVALRGLVGLGILLLCSQAVFAQQFVTGRAVGGVVVDAGGLLGQATAADLEEVRRMQAAASSNIPEAMQGKVPLRKLSLAGINRALQDALSTGRPIPDEIYCLGGLQSVCYVIADPEAKDILLVGPAEGWKPGPGGVLVGTTTGRAVMLLDDLVVALRTVSKPQPEVISCSINPRAEKLSELERFTRGMPANVAAEVVAARIEEILGPQEVTITGVPADSHFARVLVAADYRMKRIGLGLDRAPAADIPPFTAFVRGQAAGMMPRWWLVPEVSSLRHDPDGLVWEVPEVAVKTLTETQFLGIRGQGGARRSVPGAERWAEVMTSRYDQLAMADPIFDQVRNCMELSLVAAILVTHRLPEQAGADISLLLDEGRFPRAKLQPATKVPSRSVVVRSGRSALVACGGVEINPWSILAQAKENPELRKISSELRMESRSDWWSN